MFNNYWLLSVPVFIILAWSMLALRKKQRRHSSPILMLSLSLCALCLFILNAITSKSIWEYSVLLSDLLLLGLMNEYIQLIRPMARRVRMTFYGVLIVVGVGTILLPSWSIIGAIIVILTTCFWCLIVRKVRVHWSFQASLWSYVLGNILMVIGDVVENEGLALAYIILFGISITFYTIGSIQFFVSMLDESVIVSVTDVLTGLYNRGHFYKCVQLAVQKEIAAKVIFLDIDNFKHLNDTKGHAYGDIVLKKVASIIQDEIQTPGIGVCGRYGGEEIVGLVVKEGVNVDRLAERIRQRIQLEANVTASIGYSVGEAGQTAETLIKQADDAMYSSKKNGKNRVTKYISNSV